MSSKCFGAKYFSNSQKSFCAKNLKHTKKVSGYIPDVQGVKSFDLILLFSKYYSKILKNPQLYSLLFIVCYLTVSNEFFEISLCQLQ